MIQRIQTVYLGLAFVVLSLSFFFPFASFDLVTGEELLLYQNNLTLNSTVLKGFDWSFPVSFFLSFILIAILFVVFMFKKLSFQSRLGKLLYVLLLGYILFIYVNSNHLISFIENTYVLKDIQLLYLYSFYAPIVTVTLVFLANRGIKKDVDLLKSLERLR